MGAMICSHTARLSNMLLKENRINGPNSLIRSAFGIAFFKAVEKLVKSTLIKYS